jgi:ferredoxin
VEEGGTVQLTLARRGQILAVPRGQSLLAALEEAGLNPASGCRMGICNTCACGKRSGTTRGGGVNASDRKIGARNASSVRMLSTKPPGPQA